MGRRILSTLSRPSASVSSPAWICRRCFAQKVMTSAPTTSSPKVVSNTPASAVSRETNEDSYAELKSMVLPHRVPPQYLMHVDPSALNDIEREQREHLYRWAMAGHVDSHFKPKAETSRQIKGVVVSAGKMDRTVKVRIPGQRFEKRVKKYFASFTNHLAHDPNNSLQEGDVVILHKLHVSKTVRHIVASIAVPFGTPVADRPPVPTPEERLQRYKEKRLQRLDFRTLRVRAAGLDAEAIEQLQGRKQQKRQRLTESTIKQAQNYAALWMLRHNTRNMGPLRRAVKTKATRARPVVRVSKNVPALRNKQETSSETQQAKRRTKIVHST